MKTPIALLVFALCCGALASCKKEAAGGGGKNPPKKKVDTHEGLAREVIDLNAEFVDILAEASDKASAEAAAAKVDEVAAKFEAIASRMEAIGLPKGELKTKISGMFDTQEKAQEEKVNALMGTLLGDEEIGGVLTPALQAFSERMEKLTVIDAWSGEGGGE